MINFIKYPSINDFRIKSNINKWLKWYPELYNAIYTIESKLDGTNLTLNVQSNKNIFYNSRYNVLDNISTFFNLDQTIMDYEYVLDQFKKYSFDTKNELHISGELFGPNIMDRVKYGIDRIRFFNIRINNQFISQYDFYELMYKLNIEKYIVPRLGRVKGLKNALEYNEVYKSLFTPIDFNDENFEEGILIKPLYNVYVNKQGSIFFLKKRNDKFDERDKNERKRLNKLKRKNESIDPELLKYKQYFLEFITKNRMLNMFSKTGLTITDIKEMGKFIPMILEDAKKDFLVEYPEVIDKDKKDQKFIMNGGNNIASLLKNYLFDFE